MTPPRRRSVQLIALLSLALACKSSTLAPNDPAHAGRAGGSAAAPQGGPDGDLAALRDLAAHGPDAKDYPQADAIVVLARDDIALESDGRVVHRHKSIVKLFDAQRGKEKFADVHIPFDRKRQELQILTARTVNADGEAHPVSSEELSDIVPERLSEAAIYSDVRERVVSFPAVDVGSVIELEYALTTAATADAPRGGEELLGTWDPVLERTVTISAPAGVTPELEVTGAPLEPVVTDGAQGRVWTYTLRAVPDRHPEQDAPPDAAVLPRLVYAFQNSWAEVAERVAVPFARVVLPAEPAAAVRSQAEQLVQGVQRPAEQAARLFAFVAHDVRSVELELGEAGYEPHAPELVLANRYGDSRDKASLLLALAAARGITGRPVLVRTGGVPVLEHVPTLAQFDHLLVVLDVDGREVWLDPIDEDGQYGLAFAGQDNLVLPLALSGVGPAARNLVRRPAQAPGVSVADVRAKLTLAPNGDLAAAYEYQLSGYYADRASHELRALHGEPLGIFFQSAAVGIAAAAVDRAHRVGDTLSVTGPIAVSQELAIPGYAPAQAQFRVFELPDVPLGFADDMPAAGLSERQDPLYVGAPRTSRRELTLDLPPGWTVAYVPPKFEGSTPGLRFASECRATARTVRCHEQLELDQVVLAPERYADFRAALTRLGAYQRRVVLLTRS